MSNSKNVETKIWYPGSDLNDLPDEILTGDVVGRPSGIEINGEPVNIPAGSLVEVYFDGIKRQTLTYPS